MLLPDKLAGGSFLRISLCVPMIWARGLKLQVASYQTHAPARQAGRGQFVLSICASGIGGIAYNKAYLRLVSVAHCDRTAKSGWKL